MSYVCCVGKDKFGTLQVEKAAGDGVDCSRIQHRDGPTGTCIVLSGPTDRAFVSCLGANRYLTPELLRSVLPTTLARGSHVHFGGYFTTPELHTDELADVLKAFRAQGATISLDPQCVL